MGSMMARLSLPLDVGTGGGTGVIFLCRRDLGEEFALSLILHSNFPGNFASWLLRLSHALGLCPQVHHSLGPGSGGEGGRGGAVWIRGTSPFSNHAEISAGGSFPCLHSWPSWPSPLRSQDHPARPGSESSRFSLFHCAHALLAGAGSYDGGEVSGVTGATSSSVCPVTILSSVLYLPSPPHPQDFGFSLKGSCSSVGSHASPHS